MPASPEEPAPQHQEFNVDSKIGTKLAKTPKSREKSSRKAGKGGSRRELVRYQPSEPVSRYEELGDTTSQRYDQFEENKRRFGTKSTYDFNKYTTVLDESKITPEMRARAGALEAQIGSRDGLRDDGAENEEAQFSNVLRAEKVAKHQDLKSVLLSTIGATANGGTVQDGRLPVPLPPNLDAVQQATILGPGTRSRTASNIQIESSKLHQRYDLEAPKIDKEIFDKVSSTFLESI